MRYYIFFELLNSIDFETMLNQTAIKLFNIYCYASGSHFILQLEI